MTIFTIGHDIASAANAAFTAICKSFSTAATHISTWLWSLMSSATSISLGNPGFTRVIAITLTLAIVIALLLFVVQIVMSALRRDGKGLGVAVRGLLIAGGGALAAIVVVDTLLTIVTNLSAGIVKAGMGVSLSDAGPKLIAMTMVTAVSGALLLILALGLIIATVIVWFALTVRKLLIIITAVFAPVAFAGAASSLTISWVRKWIEMTLALIFSKLILVIIFVIGYSMLLDTAGKKGTNPGQDATQFIAGLLVLGLAGFAPWMALRLVHFTGSHMAEVAGMAAVGAAGGAMVASAPQKIAGHASTASSLGSHASKLTGKFGGGGGAAEGAAGAGGAGSAAAGMGAAVATGGAAAAAGAAAGGAGAVKDAATSHVADAADTAQGMAAADDKPPRPASEAGGGASSPPTPPPPPVRPDAPQGSAAAGDAAAPTPIPPPPPVRPSSPQEGTSAESSSAPPPPPPPMHVQPPPSTPPPSTEAN